MLERLDQIPWSRLRTAHGTAHGVPAAIRGLLSPDPVVVHRSYWKLDNHVVLQSDLYESAAYLPEVLMDAFELAGTAGRAAILDLLFEIGNGYALPTDKVPFEAGRAGDVRSWGPGNAPSVRDACFAGAVGALERRLADPRPLESRWRDAMERTLADLSDGPTRGEDE